MPIPAVADGEGATGAVLALFRQLHQELRDETSGLDAEGLNWVPTSGANSIATIVVHLVGSEGETLRALASLAGERDRDAEFSNGELGVDELFELLAAADDLISQVLPRIGAERLEATLALPTLPRTEVRSGLTWMVANYGHAREHLGHIQLTRQLYEAQASSDSEGTSNSA
jgi:hypothetical protein